MRTNAISGSRFTSTGAGAGATTSGDEYASNPFQAMGSLSGGSRPVTTLGVARGAGLGAAMGPRAALRSRDGQNQGPNMALGLEGQAGKGAEKVAGKRNG